MRLAFYALLLVNLGLFAASQWFAPQRPAAAPEAAMGATASAAPARTILLASERPAAAAASAAAASGAETAAVVAAVDDAAASGTPEGSVTDGGDAAAGAMPVASEATPASGAAAAAAVAPVASVVPAVATTAVTAAQAGAPRCVSLGPFRELDVAAAATLMLKRDGYEPRQRPARGPVPDDYLVMVGSLRNEADQQRVVRRLNRGGLDDAFPLPKLEDGWAVSVGVFSAPQRAERRRLAVQRMGFDAKVLERTRPGTVYWLDIALKSAAPGAPDPAAAWLKPAGPEQSLQVVACPQSGSVG